MSEVHHHTVCDICKVVLDRVVVPKIQEAIRLHRESKGGHRPGFIIISSKEHKRLYQELHPHQRFSSETLAKLEVYNLLIDGVPVIPSDSGLVLP